MHERLSDYPEYQEFLSALLTLMLCIHMGGKLKLCAKMIKARYSDKNTLSFLTRVEREYAVKILVEKTYNDFTAAFSS